MVSPGVFNRKTLNDNWVEDRHLSEDALTATGNFHKRGARAMETDLAYIGDRYDVLARISRMPPRESYAIADDGFRERQTTHLADLKDPRQHPMFASKKMSAPLIINTGNAPVCPPEKRDLKGPSTGFGAAISRHGIEDGQRFWSTAHTEFYGTDTLRVPAGRGVPRRDPADHGHAGVGTEREETKGTGMKCGRLCGENFSDSNNPSTDTVVQRSWMADGDPALTHIHHGGTKKAPPEVDNHLSLPLGKGAMSKIREDLKARQGRLCRVATNITKGAHGKSGVSLFQDD